MRSARYHRTIEIAMFVQTTVDQLSSLYQPSPTFTTGLYCSAMKATDSATDQRFEVREGRPGTGLGLFATRDIQKGDYILEYTGKKIPTKVADEMDEARYLFEIDKKWTIDGEDESNIARYINHCCEPNVEAEVHDLPAPRLSAYIVYALECDNGAVYIGQTQDLLQRWNRHASGRGAEYTSKHKPRGYVYSEEFPSREEAVAKEKWLKTGFGRKWLRREIKAGRAQQAGGHILITAVRDIRAGEELGIDYGEEYYDEFIKPVGCKCAAEKHH